VASNRKTAKQANVPTQIISAVRRNLELGREMDSWRQARNQLGTPGGTKSFPRGAQIFLLCPIFLNYVQHIFPGGQKYF